MNINTYKLDPQCPWLEFVPVSPYFQRTLTNEIIRELVAGEIQINRSHIDPQEYPGFL